MPLPARKGNWWWDCVLNIVGGCFYVSSGCTNCFVPSWNASHTHKSETVHTGVIEKKNERWVFNGKLKVLPDGHPLWTAPRKWTVENNALGPGAPLLIWIADLSDLFLFTDHPSNVVSRAIATVVQSGHIVLLLTKRTARMLSYFAGLDPRTVERWQRQIWLGFSAENQEWFDRRWPDMRPLAEAGWFNFVSLAPLLGPVTLPADFLALSKWVIVAGEQRIPRTPCRPMKPQWARAIRDQCAVAGIPFLLKQMARGAPRPPDLRVRQFPSVP